MHVLKFLAELQNAEVSPGTLLKSCCSTLHHGEFQWFSQQF